MPYIDPTKVLSPLEKVDEVEIIFDRGDREGSWSVARLKFDGNDAVGIRWNGESDSAGVGTPNAFAKPTWFILPKELSEAVIVSAQRTLQEDEEALLAGYRAMAADEAQESEAMEWIESHVGETL